MKLNRKEFLQTPRIAGTAMATENLGTLDGGVQIVRVSTKVKTGPVDLVAVMGGEPVVILIKAVEELGGMQRFVKKGQKIVVKPNIAWCPPPEVGANTHPELVGQLVKMILEAGATEVSVFDSPCDAWTKTYKRRNIGDAVEKAGGTMANGDPNAAGNFTTVSLPKAVKLKEVKIHIETP